MERDPGHALQAATSTRPSAGHPLRRLLTASGPQAPPLLRSRLSVPLLSAAGSSSGSQSLTVHDHADRITTASQHAVRRLDDLTAEMPTEPIAAVRTPRGPIRLFLIAAAAGSDPSSSRPVGYEDSQAALIAASCSFTCAIQTPKAHAGIGGDQALRAADVRI